MNKTLNAALVAATLIALSMAPMTTSALTETKYVTGPVGFFSQDLGGASLALCQLVEPTLPAACDAQAGAVNSLGGAFFDVSSFDGTAPAGGGVEVHVTATQIDGPVAEGYQLSGCSDVDDDSLADMCTDSYDSGFTGCAIRDDWIEIVDPTDPSQDIHHTDMDQYTVFVSAWADTTLIDESGSPFYVPDASESNDVGIGVGTFEVTLVSDDLLGLDDCEYEALGAGVGEAIAADDQSGSAPSNTECTDGADNDGDGNTDAADFKCWNRFDDNESA